jgi:hypothetical protein
MFYLDQGICGVNGLSPACSRGLREQWGEGVGFRIVLASFWCGGLCVASALSQVPFPIESSPEDSWTHLAGSSRRVSEVSYATPPDPFPAWIASTNMAGEPIVFVWQAPVSVYAGTNIHNGKVFAVGRTGISPVPAGPFRLYAFCRNTGSVQWEAPIVNPLLDSFSAPAIDLKNQTVLYCSGRRVQAFSIADGSVRWTASLSRSIINVSPLIVQNSAGHTRIFVTDYDGFNGGAQLYCLNADEYSQEGNAYSPGQIVWSVPIGGSSGNSVSYLAPQDGGSPHVYVATVSEAGVWERPAQPGRVLCFSVDAETAPEPEWVYENEVPLGYFGSLCVAPARADEPTGTAPSIYVASYAFSGGTDSANLVKLNAFSGQPVWSVPSNRSNSIPVPLPGGFVALAGGINGYGTTQTVQFYRDLTTDAALVWDTNGVLNVGGYTNQPVVLRFGGKNLLAVGSQPSDQVGPSSHLYLLDLSLSPQQSNFVAMEYLQVGGSPAVAGASLYSIGPGGLVALGATPHCLDVNEAGDINIDDLYSWERYNFAPVPGHGDVDRDGSMDLADRDLVTTTLRARERSAMLEGRK